MEHPIRWLFASLAGALMALPPSATAQDVMDLEIDPEEMAEIIESLRRLGVKEAPARQPGTIRLATYNVLNLFDGHDDPNYSGRNEDIDDEKPVEELVCVAQAIRAIDADILCVQEIESKQALLEFRDTYLADMGYQHVASIDVGDDRGIEQAVLSRFPITDTKIWKQIPLGGVHPEKYGNSDNWYAGEPIILKRSPIMATVEVPGSATGGEPYELTLFVMHHKAGGPAQYWRDREAAKVVEIVGEIQEQDPSRNIIVLGDFNAQRGSTSVEQYIDAGMIDAFEGARRGDPATTTHESGRRIDLILLSRTVVPEVVPGSAFTYATPVRPEEMSWRDPPPPGYASDHLPVVVDLVPRDR